MHTDDEEKYLGTEMVLDIIGNITNYITEVFPNATMFPAMGNHDYHPKNQHAPGDSEIVSALAEMWRHWLSDEAYASFQTGEYKNYTFGTSLGYSRDFDQLSIFKDIV